MSEPHRPDPSSRRNLEIIAGVATAVSAITAALALWLAYSTSSYKLGQDIGVMDTKIDQLTLAAQNLPEIGTDITRMRDAIADIQNDMARQSTLEHLIEDVIRLHPEEPGLGPKYQRLLASNIPPYARAWVSPGEILLGEDELVILAVDGELVRAPFPSKVVAFGSDARLAYLHRPEWMVHYKNVVGDIKVGQELKPGDLVGKFSSALGDGVLHFSITFRDRPIDPLLYLPPRIKPSTLKRWKDTKHKK